MAWKTHRRRALERANYECQARIAGHCLFDATQVHHRQRRSHGGGNAESNLLAVCAPCHVWIHRHAQEAVELGFLVNATVCNRCRKPAAAYLCPKCIVEVRTGRVRFLNDEGRWEISDEWEWPSPS